jgi:hypothetical protein
MGLKVTNNAFGALNAGISNSDTIIVLQAGQGARFPSLGAGDYFYATLIDTSNNLEIVKVTARATDTLTVVRAQDGTTARAYNVNDRFELRPTAALFNEIITDVESRLSATNPSYTGTLTGGTGVVNIGSGQFYKDTDGNVNIGTALTMPAFGDTRRFTVSGDQASIVINSNDTTANKFARLIFTKGNATGNEGLVRYNVNAYSMGLWTNAIERLRILGDGTRLSWLVNDVRPEFSCRAWVKFNGVNSPPTIIGSGNVSSVARTGTGLFTVNLATAMPTADYAVSALAGNPDVVNVFTHTCAGSNLTPTQPTTTQFPIKVVDGVSSLANTALITASIFA